jgi:glycosyltransferase involved in cell wall biosynthesis
MKEAELVTVVIPAYNCEQYLKESLNSIMGQDYQNLEIIIIDDNSTDQTAKIADKLAKSDPRIRVYHNSKNLGIGGNRNKGIELAKGKYIAWQDADDVATPDRVSLQVKFLEEHSEVGVVGGYLEFFGDNYKTSERKYAEDDQSLREHIFMYNPIAQPVAMFRKEVFEKVGSYHPKYLVSEDLEMLFRAGTVYKFGNVQKVLLHYRQYNLSLTRKNLRKMELLSIKIRLKFAKNNAYKARIIDYIYLAAQFVSVFFIPSNLKIAIFNFFRNS